MTLRIEIKSAELTSRTVDIKNGPRAGTSIVFHEQEAWVALPGRDGRPMPYPQRVVVNIDVDWGQAAYAPGIYTVGDASFFVNRFMSLELGRLALVPVTVQQPARVA